VSNEIRCPKCGSENVECTGEPVHSHQCHDCGYDGRLVQIDTAEVAAWLAEIGFGVDFTTDAPLPEALRWPLARAYYAADAAKHPQDNTTVNDYYATLAEECGWTEPVPAGDTP
jgi:hypothetical protein